MRVCKLYWPGLNLRPAVMLSKGVHHQENQKVHYIKASEFVQNQPGSPG